MDRCDECKSTEVRINHVEGNIACTNCGLVLQSSIIDDAPEWRNFSSESGSGANSNRVGASWNTALTNYGIDTQVKGKGQNSTDIQKWSDRNSLTTKDKQIIKGQKLIRELKTSLNLKDALVSKAEELLKKVEDDGSLRGKSVNAKVAAIIFVASR